MQWDKSPDFTSGPDGEAEGQAEVDATQELCGACVESFSLGDLELTLVAGTADFFGRLNAGNRILVSERLIDVYGRVAKRRRDGTVVVVMVVAMMLTLHLVAADPFAATFERTLAVCPYRFQYFSRHVC